MCREVDPSGPLATLRKLLLSEESIASFKRWIIDYWYAVAAIIGVVIALLVSTILNYLRLYTDVSNLLNVYQEIVDFGEDCLESLSR